MIEIGIDSFAANPAGTKISKPQAIAELLARIERADEMGLAVFGIGEHHREERGFAPVTRARFDAQNGPRGALCVGNPEEIAEKILRHSEALGGISRFSFQMDVGIPHEKLMKAIDLIGEKVVPLVA